MPRVGRVVLPNYPHHIVQKDHNWQVVLQWTRILNIIWKLLSQWREVYSIRVYAWCLITNPIHLVVEPPEETALLGQLMKRLSGRQTRYVEEVKKVIGRRIEHRRPGRLRTKQNGNRSI